LPGRFATAQAALGQYRSLVYFGLPLDYYNTYVDKVGKVSGSEVMAAAAKQLRPGQAVYVIVGNGAMTWSTGQPVVNEALEREELGMWWHDTRILPGRIGELLPRRGMTGCVGHAVRARDAGRPIGPREVDQPSGQLSVFKLRLKVFGRNMKGATDRTHRYTLIR